jgi:hypothetical protein
MWAQYKDWIYHSERLVRAPVESSNSNRLAVDAGASIDQGGNMHTKLCGLFGIYDVKEDNCKPQPRV